VLLVVEVEEIVAVGFVVVGGDFKFLNLRFASDIDFGALSFGLCDDEIKG
jgi:hypothetical protein